jgi:hypothetical protein
MSTAANMSEWLRGRPKMNCVISVCCGTMVVSSNQRVTTCGVLKVIDNLVFGSSSEAPTVALRIAFVPHSTRPTSPMRSTGGGASFDVLDGEDAEITEGPRRNLLTIYF